MRAELRQVADRCDGVRCDMAMLLLPEVFLKTWGNAALPSDGAHPTIRRFGPRPSPSVRAAHPDFLFLAEVYWDLEWVLQQQGFTYTYDKRLYDRLRERKAASVRAHLSARLTFRIIAQLLENHDEKRAAAVFAPEMHRPAAVLTYLTPGLRFFTKAN